MHTSSTSHIKVRLTEPDRIWAFRGSVRLCPTPASMSSETANCCNIEGTRQGQKEGWSGNTHAISTPSMSTRDSSGCTPGSHVKMVSGWRGGDRGGAPGARAARPPGRPRPAEEVGPGEPLCLRYRPRERKKGGREGGGEAGGRKGG